MDARPRLLGITFRSEGHRFWFALSVAGLVITSAVAVGLVLQRGRAAVPTLVAMWQYPLCAHIGVSVAALVRTRGGRRHYRAFSHDCIWFNAIAAAVYGIILLLLP